MALCGVVIEDLVKYAIGVAVGCLFAFVAQLLLYRDEDAKILEQA